MDPVTHSLAGALLSRIFPGEKIRGTLAVLLIASVAPDIDYITRFGGIDIFLRYHRGVTHGILALFAGPFIIALFARLYYRKGFFYYYFISFTGYGLHLLMDLSNQYPTRILSPFDWSKYSLGLTFIIDPYITTGLLLTVLLTIKKKAGKKLILFLSMTLMLSYVTGRYYLKGISEEFLRKNMDEYHYHLTPLPNDFLRWWFVTRSGDEYKTGFVDIMTKRVYIQDHYIYNDNTPEIMRSKERPFVQNFLYFASYPYPEVERMEGGSIVRWRELSYSFFPGDQFTATLRLDSSGRVISEEFRF